MSRGITLTLLGAATLSACVCAMPFGRRQSPDHTWHDAAGNPIAENWKTDETGKRVPDPHPHDRYGRPWVYDAEGNLVPPPPPAGSSSSTRSHSMLWLWGGNGYRSFGGSSPPRSSSSSSSVPRGGFGGTGSGSSGA
jgi:hypothetical protein